MHFNIDNRIFTVRVSSRPIFLDAQPCRAKLDRARGIIWLSDQLPRHERRRELFHELRHCWIDAKGRVVDDEADANQAAEMMDAVLEQFMQQGGDAVLESLNPLPEQSTSRQPTATMALTQAACGYCEAPMAIGSIPQDAPAWSADLGVWTINRGLLCGVCDRVTVWRETSTAEGMPLGQIVAYPPPRVLSGAEAGEWIEKHSDQINVIVA